MPACRHLLLSTALLLAGLAGTAAAQGNVELGLDAGVAFDLSDPNVTTFEFPVQSFRAGFYMTERISLEPALGLSYFKIEGADAIMALSGEVGALVHFGADGVQRGPYVRPAVGISFLDVGEESASQFSAGAGLGIKLPMTDRLSGRVEASYRHGFENDDFLATDVIGLTFGLSFFTR